MAVEGYRSLRHVVLPLCRLTVVTGATGSGKSSLYRVLRLLPGVSRGSAVARSPATAARLDAVGRPRDDRCGRARAAEPARGTVRRHPVPLQATAPEVLTARQQVRSWRFYDSFRTDAGAPGRGSQPGTFTTVLADDGADLASALQTLRELGHDGQLADAVQRAFPGSRLEVVDTDGLFGVRLHPELLPLPPPQDRHLTYAEEVRQDEWSAHGRRRMPGGDHPAP